MKGSQTFRVYYGSTKNLRWIVYDDSKQVVEGTSVSAEILDTSDKSVLNVLEVVREDVGIYSAVVDTTALGLDIGKYLIEFSCLAGGQNKVKRDFLSVRYTL